jgi:UDP-glucuronate decarboxylase
MSLHDEFLRSSLAFNTPLALALEGIRGSRIFITGASGIVGFAVAKILTKFGIDLVLHSRSENERVKTDLGSAVVWKHGVFDNDLCSLGKFDFIFHCATYGQPQKFSAEWRETVKLNVDLLFHLLAMSGKLGYASTTEIYSGLSVAAAENMVGETTPQHPRSAYIEAKRLGEAICFHSGKAISNRIALASGPYPKQDDSRALYQIIRRARDMGYVQLMGGSSSIRQYQYSFACALRFILTTAYGSHPVYNNAGPYVLSMEQLGRLLASRLAMDFVDSVVNEEVSGAPATVNIDTTLVGQEFPFLAAIDPPLEFFIDAAIEATHSV